MNTTEPLIILQGITYEKLLKDFKAIVDERIKANATQKNRAVSIKEACEELEISYRTFKKRWYDEGKADKDLIFESDIERLKLKYAYKKNKNSPK